MKSFRSRVSVLLLLFLIGSIIPAYFLEPNTKPQSEMWVAYGVLFGSIGLVMVLLFSMRYGIDQNNLFVKLGPLKLATIPLLEIEKVGRSYNPLSSPAASLKRLLIESDNRTLLIFPADEEEFVRILKSRNSNIKVAIEDNDALWKFWNWDI